MTLVGRAANNAGRKPGSLLERAPVAGRTQQKKISGGDL